MVVENKIWWSRAGAGHDPRQHFLIVSSSVNKIYTGLMPFAYFAVFICMCVPGMRAYLFSRFLSRSHEGPRDLDTHAYNLCLKSSSAFSLKTTVYYIYKLRYHVTNGAPGWRFDVVI
jgi:hypothetical protein